jgi:hypothetical protein
MCCVLELPIYSSLFLSIPAVSLFISRNRETCGCFAKSRKTKRFTKQQNNKIANATLHQVEHVSKTQK